MSALIKRRLPILLVNKKHRQSGVGKLPKKLKKPRLLRSCLECIHIIYTVMHFCITCNFKQDCSIFLLPCSKTCFENAIIMVQFFCTSLLSTVCPRSLVYFLEEYYENWTPWTFYFILDDFFIKNLTWNYASM